MENFNVPYETEREGQMEFFDNYGIPYNDDPVLNGYLDTLRTVLKTYYKSHITDKMFQYKLLK